MAEFILACLIATGIAFGFYAIFMIPVKAMTETHDD